MKQKYSDYHELVEAVRNEYLNNAGAHKQGKGKKEVKLGWVDCCEEINLYTYWQGLKYEDNKPYIKYMLVAQDWGNPGKVQEENKDFFERIKRINQGDTEIQYVTERDLTIAPTDRNLVRLFEVLGYKDIISSRRCPDLFFTNFCLGYRGGNEMIKYASDVYNASASRLVDFAGNYIVALSITLEEDGEIMATTPLIFTPFIEHNSKPKFRVVEQIPEIYAHFAGDMDVCNVDGVLLYKMLRRRQMQYSDFHELCCGITRFIDSSTWVDVSNAEEMEKVIELIVKQAVTLMPLDISDYDMINAFDKWQEEFCEDDNEEIDDAVNKIFMNEECRKTIEKEARAGRYLELAADVGIDISID